MTDSIRIDGEAFLALETVAETFHVDAVVLREAHTVGLLGRSVVRESRVLVAVDSLDRVATFVRMRVVLGMDLDACEIELMRWPR